MFAKRFISAAVMIAALVCLVITGGVAIWIAVSVIAMAAFWEVCRAIGLLDGDKAKKALVVVGMCLAAVMYIISGFVDYKMAFTMVPLGYLIILMGVYVFRYGSMSVVNVQQLIFSFMYATVMIGFIPVVRDYYESGLYLVWLFLIPPVASDTLAYCVGSLIGKHKFAPVVSPKKSVEGAVGGLIGGAVFTGIYGYYLTTVIGGGFGLIAACTVLGLVCAGVSQLGDLAASAIKREMGIKDYGNIIPGHGGVMDRIDSILYIAPIVYVGSIVIVNYLL